jgi:hypothetical protein
MIDPRGIREVLFSMQLDNQHVRVFMGRSDEGLYTVRK